MDDHNRRLLGAFIRAHRERQDPPTKASRRRTPGLRREELAEAAGLGVTWITWLEQGRRVQASAAALGRLAAALHLSPAERSSLFELAGRHDPSAAPTPADDVSPGLADLVSCLDVPAYVLDHGWTARCWNAAAAELFAGWLDATAPERNLLRYVFLSPAARALIAGWEERAHRLVGEFRADFHRHPGDAALQSLVHGLAQRSPDFARLWRQPDVLEREGGARLFHHPRHGVLQFRQVTLLAAAQRDLKVVVLMPGPR